MTNRTPTLWKVSARREAVLLLKQLWPTLETDKRAQLVRAILNGPPRNLYKRDLNDKQWIELRDSEVGKWLTTISRDHGEGSLPHEGQQALGALRAQHPNWSLSDWEGQGFVSWSFGGGGIGAPSELSAKEVVSKSSDDLVRMVSE